MRYTRTLRLNAQGLNWILSDCRYVHKGNLLKSIKNPHQDFDARRRTSNVARITHPELGFMCFQRVVGEIESLHNSELFKIDKSSSKIAHKGQVVSRNSGRLEMLDCNYRWFTRSDGSFWWNRTFGSNIWAAVKENFRSRAAEEGWSFCDAFLLRLSFDQLKNAKRKAAILNNLLKYAEKAHLS